MRCRAYFFLQFSPDVVNQLSNRLESPETSPERQTILDAHIRTRIQHELEHLRREEEHVQGEIERALEKENLDRERAMAGDALEGDGSGAGEVRSSTVLRGDLEEVQGKISRYQSRKELTEYPEVKSRGDAVVECYRYASCKLIHLEHFFDMVVGEILPRRLTAGKRLISSKYLLQN